MTPEQKLHHLSNYINLYVEEYTDRLIGYNSMWNLMKTYGVLPLEYSSHPVTLGFDCYLRSFEENIK
jgi:hypothetical protein